MLALSPAKENTKKISASFSIISSKDMKESGGKLKKSSESSIVKSSGGALTLPIKENTKKISAVSKIIKIQEKQKEKSFKEEKKITAKQADTGEKINTEKLLEDGPEKSSNSGLKISAPSISTPGFFDRILKFVLYTALGWLLDKIKDPASIINKAFESIGNLINSFVEWFPKFLDTTFKLFEIAGPSIIKYGGILFDGITSAIDIGYKTYEKIRETTLKRKDGEESAKKLDQFSDGINKFIDGALIFGTAMLLFGDDLIPDLSKDSSPDKKQKKQIDQEQKKQKTKINSEQIKQKTKINSNISFNKISTESIKTNDSLKNYLDRDIKQKKIERTFGNTGSKIYDNAYKNGIESGKTPTQARITATAAVERTVKSQKIQAKPAGSGLSGKTAPKGAILKGFGGQGLKKGIDKATQRFFIKIIGMGGVKVLKSILSKIPIVGPLITFALNWASGESIAKSATMAVGSALGQMFGTWAGGALGVLGGPFAPVTVPLGLFVGNVLGGMGGELLGGFLFDLVTGKKGEPGEVFSSAVEIVKKFFQKDFQKTITGFLGWIGNSIVSGVQGLWNTLTSMAKFIGGLDFFKSLKKATNNIRFSINSLWDKKGDIFNPTKFMDYLGTIRNAIGEMYKIMINPGLGSFLMDNAIKPFFNDVGKLWKNKNKLFEFIMNSGKNIGAFVMKEGTFQDVTGTGGELSLSKEIQKLVSGGAVGMNENPNNIKIKPDDGANSENRISQYKLSPKVVEKYSYNKGGKIFLHWTAGNYNFKEKGHYHTIVQGDGSLYKAHPYSQRSGVSHTYRRNSEGVGLSVASMGGKPDPWSQPPKEIQLESLAKEIANIGKAWGWSPNDINLKNVMTHAEAASNKDGGTKHDNYGPQAWGGTGERWDFLQLRKNEKNGSGGDNIRAKARGFMGGDSTVKSENSGNSVVEPGKTSTTSPDSSSSSTPDSKSFFSSLADLMEVLLSGGSKIDKPGAGEADQYSQSKEKLKEEKGSPASKISPANLTPTKIPKIAETLKSINQPIFYDEPIPNTQLIFVTKETTYVK